MPVYVSDHLCTIRSVNIHKVSNPHADNVKALMVGPVHVHVHTLALVPGKLMSVLEQE